MKQYVELAVGHCGHRGNIVLIDDIVKHIKPSRPLYRSWYSFDKGLLAHMEQKGTIAGYSGNYYLNEIIMDIDKGEGSNADVLEKARSFVEVLSKKHHIPDEYIQPWFSGTGYHIVIPDVFGFEPSATLPREVKATLTEYFPQADDIYDGARLIRIGYTVNIKTKLYKVPLSLEELLSCSYQEVHEIARTPQPRFPIKKIESADILLPKIAFKTIQKSNESNTDTNVKNSVGGPIGDIEAIATCKWNIWKKGPVEGSRHESILRMASIDLRNSVPLDGAKAMYRYWGGSMDAIEVDNAVESVYKTPLLYNCHDRVLDAHCDKRCIFYPKKAKGLDPLVTVNTMADLEKEYVNMVRNEDKNSIAYFHKSFPSVPTSVKLRGGELAVLIGNTGLGKTALVQNLIYHLKMPTLWLTLEFGMSLLFRRFVQIAKGVTAEQVDHYYAENDNGWSSENAHIMPMSTPPTIEGLKKLIATTSAKLVVIDTIDGINVGYTNDSMFKMDAIVAGLREIVDLYKVGIIAVAHTTKGDGGSSDLNIHSAKYSSSVAQKSDMIMALNAEMDDRQRPINMVRTFNSLKVRDGNGFKTKLRFEPETFRFIAT